MQKERISNFKYAFLIIGILGSLGVVSLIIHFLNLFPKVNWRQFIGLLLIISGIFLIYGLFILRSTALKNKKTLFYAILFNPGLVQIFSGIVLLTIGYGKLNYIFMLSGAGILLSFVIGLVILIKSLTTTQ
jgi:hypothetical protein